ncbi:MAG: DUF4863 family protein [Gammaproteobacteria bacterium]|nr:DUF4863 family protein [Gammaproteobacteria bacterium]NIR83251.1 DUF4863 family protein [Gammaproteobacteria bacterium]NIR91055.1 DUF4863 family protein [Gammaproteobacteria bacterium]NIU04416.1 DUF4863 family protein [Gammaproteobacteria bacterium]NIV76371.1 DUF4863 family protein [Gammaproteobacteria bacterium]
MNREEFRRLITPVTEMLAGKAVDGQLAEELNRSFPPEGEAFRAIEAGCHQAIADGWMCARGGAGRRFGRIIEPGPETHGFSVDVVDITDFKGPHHRHPTGEICMVMPVTETATFCGNGRGWCVYEPGSAHHPTVAGGEALVLYMLPEGRIEFTE